MDRRPVIVIDDHELAHSGIRLLLADSREFDLVGCHTNAEDGIDQAASLSDPIILLDLELPGLDGLSALDQIRIRGLGDVVIVTGVTRPELLRQAFEQGAAGIVCKGDPISEVREALRCAAAGERFLSAQAGRLIDQSAAIALSARQKAILELLAAGNSNKEISYRLSISQPTVSYHIAEIRRRLDVGNSRQLVDKARELGILPNSST